MKQIEENPADILKKIRRMKDTTANAIVDFFLSEKLEWEHFRSQIDSIHRFGFCVCGMFATDNSVQYKNKNLCIYCRENSRQDILVVPNLDTIRRIEKTKPGSVWYHVVNTTTRESETDSLSRLIQNVHHKKSAFNKNPTVRNFLGADSLSREVFENIKETLYEKFKDEISVVDLPVGIGIGQNIHQLNDITLFLLMETKK